MVNSETALNVLSYIKDYAKQNDITKIVNAGDFFHTKARAYAPHVIQAWLRVKDIAKQGIEHYMLVGNHDMSNPSTTMNSILFVFSDYAKVIPDYYFIDTPNSRIHFLSYTNTLFEGFILAEDKKNILITHLDIIGFSMSNGFQSVSGFRMEDFQEFDHVFTGHYHEHQTKKNITYIGSPYQTSFSERGQKKGFVVLDTETFEWEFVEINGVPKYKIVDLSNVEDLSEDMVENNFLRVKLQNHDISKSKLKEKILELGAISVDVIPPEDTYEIEKYYESDLSDEPVEIAGAYLKSINNLSLDQRKLLKYFEKIQEISNNIAEYEV